METTLVMEMTPGATPRAEPDAIPSERALIAASLKGDSDAFSELVLRHQRRVFRLAGRFFLQRADVEDAAQETFLTAWRKLSTYKARAPFEHWLTRICLNCCYQKLRSHRPTETLSEREPAQLDAPDPNASLEVERLLSALDPKDRFVLLLLDGEGWSVSEIASRIGWSSVNVKVRAHRARRKLRNILERG